MAYNFIDVTEDDNNHITVVAYYIIMSSDSTSAGSTTCIILCRLNQKYILIFSTLFADVIFIIGFCQVPTINNNSYNDYYDA